jgi:hypothetical protein
MSKNIGFRCPENILQEIEGKITATGKNKSEIIIEMIKGLPSAEIEERKTLPSIEAIYLVWTSDKLLYVGQTVNLYERFKNHHRLVEFLNCSARIAWFDPDGCDRLEVEAILIDVLCPELNRQRVEGYVVSPFKKKSLPAQFDEVERQKIEQLAVKWGISLSGAIRRIVREYQDV